MVGGLFLMQLSCNVLSLVGWGVVALGQWLPDNPAEGEQAQVPAIHNRYVVVASYEPQTQPTGTIL